MTWGFIWLMFVLKIPIIGLLWLVWWAIRQSDDPVQGEKVRPRPHPPSRARRPRRPRGPHGDPLPLPPPRVRTTSAISREHADR
jgi:hypothetical protein